MIKPRNQHSVAKLLRGTSSLFEQFTRYGLADRAIAYYVEARPSHRDLAAVLGKVSIINSLYGTIIYDVVAMAESIYSIPKIDTRISKGDLMVVEGIRRGHGINTASGKDRDFYSFATKYLNAHNRSAYPIVDSLVKRLLGNLNRQINFTEKFTQDDLLDYSLFQQVIDALAKHIGLQAKSYKFLDQGFWVYAKYVYKPKELPRGLLGKIRRLESESGFRLRIQTKR